MIMREPRVNVGDDVAAIDYLDQGGNYRVLAVNNAGKILLSFSAESIRAKADYGVVAITYRSASGERAIALEANGRVLLADNRSYIQPRFTIDPYVLIFRHSQGMEQIAH
jgi:hypothetical protein